MMDFQADRFRAGENETVHVRIGDEFVAGGVAGAGDEVEHAGRQSSVAQNFIQAEAGPGRVAGGLEHNCVSSNQSPGSHARGEGNREVERRDHGPDPVRLEHAPSLLGAGATHRHFVSIVPFDLLAVIENEVDGLGHFRNGLETVLADFQTDHCGEFILALRHQFGGLAQEGDALAPAEAAPGGKDGLGGGDGLARVFAAAELKFAEQHARVSGRGVGERAGFRLDCFAFDEHGMGSAEPGPEPLVCRIERLMKILSQRTKGSVSDLFHKPEYG